MANSYLKEHHHQQEIKKLTISAWVKRGYFFRCTTSNLFGAIMNR